MTLNTNTINKPDLYAELASLKSRLSRLEKILSGEPISVVRIADASITSAKIASLSADKITTGTLQVGVAIKIRNSGDTGDIGVIGTI